MRQFTLSPAQRILLFQKFHFKTNGLKKISHDYKIFLIAFFSFVLFSISNLSLAQTNFTSGGLAGAAVTNPTSLQYGPDNRLYVSQQNGIIKVFTVVRNSVNNYVATSTETIDLINQIPNHNDDGSESAITTRQITGILVTGTASNPVIYVTSSDSRIGGPNGDLNLDTNSGIISMLRWNGSAWVKIDLVRGLPRSEENHSPNGMQLDVSTNTLYLPIGGFTNAGSPSLKFAYISEYALSAAILSIDLDVILNMPTQGSGNTAFKYDLPTLDDPTRTNVNGKDINDPFGGNDGLNQAIIDPNGPVQIFSPGYRNAYDLLITKTPGKAGRIYTIDNGANQGWGGYPDKEGPLGLATNNYVPGEPGSDGPGVNDPQVNNLDNLHYIGNLSTYQPGSYYGGHPNPTRANPSGAGLYTRHNSTGVWRTSKSAPNPLPQDWPPVQVANPIEGDFQLPGSNQSSSILTFTHSTNGLAEYTASNFNNALKGVILAASFDGSIYKITPTADGTNVTNAKNSTNKLNQDMPFASGFGSTPLDITTQGDDDIFPGTVWVATYGTHAITIFEPQDMSNCSGADNELDDDADGFTNADELDNHTNPCSAASQPKDFDGDKVSDLNDPDDDNDGISDITDNFQIDPFNGLNTIIPVEYNLFNNDPGTGFFGVGFNGMMVNGTTNYLNMFDENNMIVGGAVGAFTIVNVPPGDALGTINTQQNGFQFGFKPGNIPFTVNARMLGNFFNGQAPANFQSQGIFIGTGDQSNYLKITLNANGGSGGIEVVYEVNDNPSSNQYNIPGGIPSLSLDLYFSVDPVSGTVQPKIASNAGTLFNIGPTIQLSGALLNLLQNNQVLAIGIISTSRASQTFTATWDYLKINPDENPTQVIGNWQTIAPNTGTVIAREENAYVQAGNKFYLIGGRGIAPVQEYDPVNKSWINKSNPPLELHHFQAVNLNGLIYVAGAFTGGYPHEVPVPQVRIYNPASDKWFIGSTIPESRRRGSAGAVVYNNKIYLICGIIDGHWSGFVNWFDEYDPVTNTWKTLPDAPRVRDHFQAAVHNNKLYIVGGRRSSASTGQLFNLTVPEVDVFDFLTGTWSTLPSDDNLPFPRAGSATSKIGNEIIIVGGESSQPTAHKETHALNVQTNKWRRLADLQQGRHGTQVFENNNGLYIVAGAGNQGGSNLLTSQEGFYFSNPTTPGGFNLTQSQITTPSSINFGNVQVSDEVVKYLSLSNINGLQDIMVTSINLSGGSFSFLTPVKLPFVIPVGQSIDITVTFNPVTQVNYQGSITINHSGQNTSNTISLTGQGIGGNYAVYRINAGGPQVTNSIGTFAADNFYSPLPGKTYTVSKEILGTTDDAMYQTERYGTDAILNYAFPVSNGNYSVILHFSENWWTAVNKRKFDITIESILVKDNFDLFAKVGQYTATTETFNVVVNDGTLNIDFSALAAVGGLDNPKVSAIEIISTTATNQPPLVNAGNDQTITLPANSVTLSGSATDDGTINSYAWTKFSGPASGTITSPSTGSTTVTGLVQGTYVFRLTATDNGSPALSSFDDVTITVNPAPAVNQPPIVNAGNDQTITLPANSVTLTGSATDDGTINSYAWTKFSGPALGTITSPSTGSTTVTGIVQGTYVFRLTATDNGSPALSSFDDVTITVNPAPTSNVVYRINAGGPQVTNSIGTFAADNFYSPLPGKTYTVSKEILGTTDDAMYQTERYGTDAILNYAFPVSNGNYSVILHFSENWWTAVNKRKFDITIESILVKDNFDLFAKVGQYTATTETFNVVVNDGTLNIDFSALAAVGGLDNPKVSAIEIISTTATNQPPLVNAGNDQTITLPANSVTLSGSATDDGTINSYAWTKFSGPASGTITSPSTGSTTVTGLVQGTYVFRLTATDNGSPALSSFDDVTITVNPAPAVNQPPIVNAGNDQTITLPANSVTLTGSATDDGTINSYAWTKFSGPALGTITSPSTGSTTVTGIVQGTYVFRLTATDNGSPALSSFDDVTITVNPAPTSNVVYRINAGGPQVTNSIGTFAADNFYSPLPGNTYTVSKEILGTTDDAMYQTERNGINALLDYAFPVSNGNYSVILHFSENRLSGRNKRKFDIKIEGVLVKDNFDIFGKAGRYTATSETFIATVNDGVLNINFNALASVGGVNTPTISAIEILSTTSTSTVNEILTENEETLNVILKAYPNPTSDGKVILSIHGETGEELTYHLMSTSGKILSSGRLIIEDPTTIVSFDFSKQMNTAGVYFLQLKSKMGPSIIKVIRLN